MGAIRSLRFSPDGRFLAMAEPADFVHIYDVQAGFSQVRLSVVNLEHSRRLTGMLLRVLAVEDTNCCLQTPGRPLSEGGV